MFSLNPLPSLPPYSGPYNVGSTEYEIPISEIDAESTPPDPKVTTIKYRLYYPTPATSSKESIPWIPNPQRKYINAFSSFLGGAEGWSSFITPILSVMNCITVPALANAPLLKQTQSRRYPLAIFSHGLAGNSTMYSAICGSLASCGVICAAPEHRDGSVPISWIRGPGGEIISEVPYWKLSHDLTTQVFEGRNTQMRIRLWELDLLYSALTKMNEGQRLTNYATKASSDPSDFESSLDLYPGHVCWLGHSFGAATVTQFIKSIYYYRALPTAESSSGMEDKPISLYTPTSESHLVSQVTSDSPLVLLDVFTLPFRSPATRWLWEKPLPCYDRSSSSSPPIKVSTVAIMSNEFYSYTNMRKRTLALLSPNPALAEKTLFSEAATKSKPDLAPSSPVIPGAVSKPDETTHLESDIIPAPADPVASSTASISSSRDSSPSSRDTSPANKPSATASSSNTSLSTPPPQSETSRDILSPKLFYIPSSAHLSQSDFGLLFPTITKYLMKAHDSQGTINLNVRAILNTMNNAGLQVTTIDQPKKHEGRGWFSSWRATTEHEKHHNMKDEQEDTILSGSRNVPGTNGRWLELDIPQTF